MRWQWCWWHRYFGGTIIMLATFFVMLVIHQCTKSIANILNRWPTSQTCHQHTWSRTSVTNINATRTWWWPTLIPNTQKLSLTINCQHQNVMNNIVSRCCWQPNVDDFRMVTSIRCSRSESLCKWPTLSVHNVKRQHPCNPMKPFHFFQNNGIWTFFFNLLCSCL